MISSERFFTFYSDASPFLKYTVKNKLNLFYYVTQKLIYYNPTLKQMVCFVQLRHSTIHYLCIKCALCELMCEFANRIFFMVITITMALNDSVSQISPSLFSVLSSYVIVCWECVCIINRNHIGIKLLFFIFFSVLIALFSVDKFGIFFFGGFNLSMNIKMWHFHVD